MNQRLRFVISVVSALAVLAVLSWLTVSNPPGQDSLVPGLIFGFMIVFTTTFGVPLAGGQGSLGPTSTVAAFLVMGMVPAAWVAFLGALVHGYIRYRWSAALGERMESGLAPITLALVNATLQASSVLVGGAVFRLLGGSVPYTGMSLDRGLPVVLAAATYLATNLLMAGLYFATRGRDPLRYYLRSVHRVLVYEGLPMVFAPFLALIYTRLGLVQFGTMALAIVLVSLIMRNLSLARQRLERRVNELDSLQAVGQALSASLDLDTILVAIHTQVSRLMRARNFYVALYDPDTQEVSFPLAIEAGERVRWRSRRAGNGLTEHVLLERAPLLISRDYDETVSALGLQKFGRPAISWLGVPILAGEDALGVITVQSFSEHAYDFSHQEVLVTIAAQAAVAIQNARLYARTDEALARRVRELDSILRTVQEGILLFDGEYRVVAANRALAGFLGVAQLELLGRSLYEPLPELGEPILSLVRYAPSDLQAECEALAHGELDFRKAEIVFAGPPEKHFERTLTPVHDREQEISGWLLALHDATEEWELAELREEMTNMLVHDLRSPLTVLISGLELIAIELATGDTEAVTKVLALARQSSDHLLRLINDLLDISRLESGQLSVAPQEVEVRPLLEEVANRLMPLAEPARITMEVEADPGLPPLYVDPYIIDRVVHNLVDNALKFTPVGGRISLWARLEPEREQPGLVLGVTDTGPGIPLSEHARVFQKYQQIDGSAGRRKGTGLGLPFCKLAIEAHGGRIWVESEVGKGSSFVMRLAMVDGK